MRRRTHRKLAGTAGLKSKSGRSKVQRSDRENHATAEDVQQPVPLDNLPIREPEKEKSLLEKKGHLAWIIYLSNGRPSFFLPDAETSRISEVYRLCYEKKRSLKVITDFVAHFTPVVFQSPWLATLVSLSTRQPPENRRECMRALYNGFKRAARPTRNLRQVRQGRIEAARYARRQLRQHFSDFDKSLDREHATVEFIREQVVAYVEKLLNEDARLKPLRGRLLKMLKDGALYEASVLIVATQFQVRVRDLETSARR